MAKHESFDLPDENPTPEQFQRIIEETIRCACSWDSKARILGNVRAGDLARALNLFAGYILSRRMARKVSVKALLWGDRFLYKGHLWTVISMDPEWVQARKHDNASVALGDRGYGYHDHVCSFKPSQKVEFVPPRY
jgi:hypothetical protein